MQTLKIFSDGGSRGNPGPAAIGVVIKTSKDGGALTELVELSEYVGDGTNNFAEYMAVIRALGWVSENIKEPVQVNCLLDSQLVVEQLNQRYKLKNEGLKPLFWQVRELVMSLGGQVTFEYIPRTENQEADALVNKALDERMSR